MRHAAAMGRLNGGGSRPGAHAAIAASPTSLRRANMFTARARVRNTLDLTPQRETMRHLSTARRFRRVPCPVSNCLCTRAHCIQGSRRTLQARVPPTPRRPTLRPSSPRSRLVAQMEAPSNCSSPTGGACGTAMGRTFSRRRGEAEARRPGHGQRITCAYRICVTRIRARGTRTSGADGRSGSTVASSLAALDPPVRCS